MATVAANPKLYFDNDVIGGSDKEFFCSEGLDVEYITRMLKEAEDDPGPWLSLEELKESLSKRFGP